MPKTEKRVNDNSNKYPIQQFNNKSTFNYTLYKSTLHIMFSNCSTINISFRQVSHVLTQYLVNNQMSCSFSHNACRIIFPTVTFRRLMTSYQ